MGTTLEKLIEYCRDAVEQGYPFEVTEDSAATTLEALELLKAKRDAEQPESKS